MNASTINAGSTVRLLDGATLVAATVTYNAGTNTATLTPSVAAGEFEDLHDLGHRRSKRRQGSGRQRHGDLRSQRIHHRRDH